MYGNDNNLGYGTFGTDNNDVANNNAANSNVTNSNTTNSDLGSGVYSGNDNYSSKANDIASRDTDSQRATYNMNEDGTYRGVYSNSYFEDLSWRDEGNKSNHTSSASGMSTAYNGAAEPAKKKKSGKAGGFFKKALVSVCLGLFFGVFAGVGFYAVQQVTGMLNPEEVQEQEAVTDVLADNPINSGMQLTNTSNVTVVQSNVVDVAEDVMPAMVSIINKYTVTSNFWGQTYSEEAASSGSGIIVGKTDTELLIVSNNHVVEGAETLEITFIDGAVAEARIKGLDSDMDLAVIAVALEDVSGETMDAITVATLGNSDDLKLGEPVIAIGNALGYGQSVTDGIVSALDREITMDDGSTGIFIQTNAAINPGNSGGALLNVNGEVIGINTSKIGGTAIEGMGYAIPITSASPIIADLMERQTRNKVAEGEMGYMGISLQEVTAQIASMYNWPQGIYVLSVEEGSPAQKAGIMMGDIIVKFDGQKISSYEELQDVMQYYAVGDTTEITVMRPENGQYVEYDLNITLGERPTGR